MKEKIKSLINNFIIFSNSNFHPSSYEYFSKKFDSTYSKISFDIDGINFDSKSEIKLSSLNERLPFIEKLVALRKTTDSFEKFKELSYVVFIEYLKVLKQTNILYHFNSPYQKETLFAQNVVNDHRNHFYSNLKKILLLIEKEYSSSIKEKVTNEKISKTDNKTGPKPFTPRIFTGLKYGLIHHFDKEKRRQDLKKSNEDFYRKIKEKKDVDIKAIYSELFKENHNLRTYFQLKNRNKYIEPLLSDIEIKSYPKIVEFLNKMKNSINSN